VDHLLEKPAVDNGQGKVFNCLSFNNHPAVHLITTEGQSLNLDNDILNFRKQPDHLAFLLAVVGNDMDKNVVFRHVSF
jgi:hypothetical protein